VGSGKSLKCIRGGGAFVFPIKQSYSFLDLNIQEIETDINVLCKNNTNLLIQSKINFQINNQQDYVEIAAERFLGLKNDEIKSVAKDIIEGQIRVFVANIDKTEILEDKERFISIVSESIDSEIKKIGLKLISFDLKNISEK